MSPRKRVLAAALGLAAIAAALAFTELGQRLVDRLVLEAGPRAARAWALDRSRGPEARPLLQVAIADPDRDLRWKALDRLLALGPEAAPAVPAILRSITEPILWDRSSRDFGILICDPSPHGPPFAPDTIANMIALTIGAPAIPLLLRELESPRDPRTRWLAAYTLALFGSKLPAACAPRLEQALQDADTPTRYHLAAALLAIGEPRRIPLRELEDALESDDPYRPGLALRIVEARARTPRSLVPAILTIAEGKNPHIAPVLAMPALGRTGIENQGKVVPCLVRCRKQRDDPELARAAARALEALGFMRRGAPSDG